MATKTSKRADVYSRVTNQIIEQTGARRPALAPAVECNACRGTHYAAVEKQRRGL